jgi:hypothetical protein
MTAGEHTIQEIKDKFGVPDSDHLAQFKDGKLGASLKDDAVICIKGGEEFLIVKGSGHTS